MNPIKVLKVSQPIGEFYIGAIDSETLLKIAHADVRQFTEGSPDKIDGIQRGLSKSRLKELKEYVNLDYATFPTSVILAIDHRCVNLDEVDGCSGMFELKVIEYDGSDYENDTPINLDKAAFVIDGQHRLAGLKDLCQSKEPFQLNVSIFVGADIADQAEIFARVNLAQTKVNKSLAYDLFDYAKEKSPIKVSHDVVLALNSDDKGPFYHRIKRLGVRTPGIDGETLAQATVVNGLLRHLPKHQEKERSKSLLNISWKKEHNESWKDRIFVDFYRNDDFVSIFLNVSNFFEAVRLKWPDAWNNPVEGQILARTTGFNALIRFMKDAYLYILSSEPTPRVIKIEEYNKVFDKMDIEEKQLNKDDYVPGSSGQGKLYKDLKVQGLS